MAANRRSDRIHRLVSSVHLLSSALEGLLAEEFEARSRSGLALSQVTLLELVALTDPGSITEVAEFLHVSSAAASKAIDKLVRRRLVRRITKPQDRRAFRLALTPAGQRLVDRFAAVRKATLARLAGRMPGAELDAAVRTLDRLATRIVDQHPNADEVCLRCGVYFRETCLLSEAGGRSCHSDRTRR